MAVRILLVDDHPIVRQGLRTLLEGRSGWEVVGEASDGIEAVEKVTARGREMPLLRSNEKVVPVGDGSISI